LARFGTHLEYVGATVEEIAAKVKVEQVNNAQGRRAPCHPPISDDLLRQLLDVNYLFHQEPAADGTAPRFRTRHEPSRFRRGLRKLTTPTKWQPPATAYKYTASVRLARQRVNSDWQRNNNEDGIKAPAPEQILTTEELMRVVTSSDFDARWP